MGLGKLFPCQGTDYKATPFGNDAESELLNLQEEEIKMLIQTDRRKKVAYDIERFVRAG